MSRARDIANLLSTDSPLIDNAPDALNTLNELAAALGDDENFATTVTNSLAGKADTDKFNVPTTNELALRPDGSTEAVRIDSLGRVGIGTTNPIYELDVHAADGSNVDFRLRSGDTVGDDVVLRLENGYSGGQNYIYFGDADDTNAGQITYYHDTDDLRIFTNAGERMRIDSSGNVGIGTTDPDGRRLRIDDSSFDDHLLITRSSAPDLHITTSSSGPEAAIIFAGSTFSNGIYLYENGQFAVPDGPALIGTTTPGSAGAGDLVVNGGVFLGGSAAANELDDYEEGTWTPTVTPGSGSFTTITIIDAHYTRIGRVVTAFAEWTITSVGTGSGTMNITLPFTVDAEIDRMSATGRHINIGDFIQGRCDPFGDAIAGIVYADSSSAIVDGNLYVITATYFTDA